MTTENQIKIETLTVELNNKIKDIENCYCEIENLMQQIVKYESGTQIRTDEIAESEKKLETFKNSIPDFSEEKCEMYVKYNDIKSEHLKLSKFYKEIDDRIEKLKDELTCKRAHIAEANQRIDYLNNALKKAKAEGELKL